MEHHRAGRYRQAEELYRKLRRDPDALHLLGLLLEQQGRLPEALDALQQAIALKPDHVAYYLSADAVYRALDRLADLPPLYEALLARQPAAAEAQLRLGHAYRDGGQLESALASYLNVLALQPDSAQAYASLGGTLKAMQQIDEAETCYLKALELEPGFAEVHNNLGTLYQQRQQHEQAAAHFDAALALQPDFAEAHFNLGVSRQAQEQLDVAIACYRRAIAQRPSFSAPYNNIGTAYKGLDRLDDAVEAYRAALALQPAFPEALNNLGGALTDLKQYDEAIALFEQALRLKPGYPEAYHNMGNAYQLSYRHEEALICFHNAVHLKPDYADAYSMLALTYSSLARHEQALEWCKKTLALWPDSPAAHFNLGVAYTNLDKTFAAISSFKEAIVRKPAFADAHNNLGVAYRTAGSLVDSVSHFRQALALRPNFAEAHNNLGAAQKDQGMPDLARAQYEAAISVAPHYAAAHNNLLLSMQYASDIDADELFALHQRFAAQFEPELAPLRLPHDNAADPGKRLKIAYVSPDLRQHAVAYFIEPVLAQHDKAEVEVYCYYNHTAEDIVTARLKSHADHWVATHAMSDQQLADRIRADGIDVVIDLAGHTAGNRLLALARKPAPVQVSYLGYPATTGLESIDYRLTDGYAEPPGMTERYNVEQLWRLPEIFCCYAAHPNSPDVIDHPPLDDNGHITFGCFNNYAKVSDQAITLWAAILAKVPGAKLMLEILGLDNPGFRDGVEQRFARLGIDPARLILIANDRKNQYVLYNRIDIALDPFPCNGGTTSLDTLWMGVPFVSLAGTNFISRLGVTILNNGGLAELVAADGPDYIRIASELALDPDRLRRMRAGLRARVQTSPLMDVARFTRHLEQAYRGMWQAWCSRAGGENAAHNERTS
jgi:predicted O-linked N-acetylglucosamine transferase (SPINDLY family)